MFAYVLLLAVVATAACVVFAFPHSAPSCDEALVPESVPRSLSGWVEVPGMGGFRIVHGQPPDEAAEFVVEDGVCPGAGAPLPAPALGDLRVRHFPGFDNFVLTRAGASLDAPERAILAFRPSPRLAVVIPPKTTRLLAGLCLAAGVAVAWGIARARRRLRLAGELLDPDRFVEATCKEDGTLWIGDGAAVVRGDPHGTWRPGRVVVRVTRESGGDYRTPPTAHVADVFRGDRRQASDRQLRHASLILSAFTAVTLSVAIVAGILSVNAWVSQEEAQREAFSHRRALRESRIAALADP